MANSPRVSEAIQKVFSEWNSMSTKEFNEMLEKYEVGDLAREIEYGLDGNSTADSIENLQDSVSTTDKSTK